MANIPRQWFDSVFALGFETSTGVHWGGTGFGYYYATDSRPDPSSGDRTIYSGRGYVVTNKHVIEGHDMMKIRCNPSADDPAKDYSVRLRGDDGSTLWTGHPDVSIDVAVVAINYEVLQGEGMRVEAFVAGPAAEKSAIARRAELIEYGVTEGDDVFVLGFPMSMVGGDRNYVIVRSGCISRIQDALVGSSSEYLIDAQVFPGNSGGPVLSRAQPFSLKGTKAIDRSMLIGMVKAYVPYRDVAVSQQTGNARVVFEENTGLTAVIPVDFIDEAIAEDIRRSALEPKLPLPDEDSEEYEPPVPST